MNPLTLSTRCGSGGCGTIFRNNVAALADSVRLGLEQCSHDNLQLSLLQSSQISGWSGHGIARCGRTHLITYLDSADAMLYRKAHRWTANFCAMASTALYGNTGCDDAFGTRCSFCVFSQPWEFVKNTAVWDVNKN